jgi:hypothetical protein
MYLDQCSPRGTGKATTNLRQDGIQTSNLENNMAFVNDMLKIKCPISLGGVVNGIFPVSDSHEARAPQMGDSFYKY